MLLLKKLSINTRQLKTIKSYSLISTPTSISNIADLLFIDLEETMRIITQAIIKVTSLLLLLVVLLIAGCSGKKCEIDSDCGQASCSENQRKALNQTCVDGRCETTTTECDDSEVCVADSLGVRCETADPDTGKARMSCSDNTDTFSIMGINAFNPTIYICGADCPVDSYCSESCYCEEKVEISCSGNTDDAILNGENIFDQRIEMCADDCPGGHDCNTQCICEERPRPPCPDPEFESNYFGEIPVDYDFETLANLWLDDSRNLLDLEPTINITAYVHKRGGTFYYIPFPEVQLELIPNPDNEYILQYGAYCVNDYYDGAEALDINLEWLDRPEETCIWGGTEGFEGVLTVCPEDVIDWFYTYSANINLLW